MTLAHLRRNPDLEITEAELEDVADGVMMEDVIRRQKLEAEIREGEEAVQGFTVTEVSEAGDISKVETKADLSKLEDNSEGVDLTPSLSGAQTLSLTEDGEWRSDNN